MFWRMLWFALVMTVTPIVVTAQGVCDSALLDEALARLGDRCADLDRNTACYGNDAVDVTFVPGSGTFIFTQPSDQLPLATLDTLTTAAYNPAQNEWGIAVMNVQANLPGTLPGQGVVMLVLGGAELTNESPDTAPMQAFTFQSGVGRGDCNAAPALLAVRSPENVTVSLTMNGLDFTLGSTLLLLDNQNGSFTAVLTEGQMVLTDGTTLNAGQALDLTVDPVTLVITAYGTPRAANPDELALANTITPLLETVTPDERLYTVQRGDNLFRIALENGTCVSEVARVNGIPTSQVRNIAVGRVLVIPDGTTCGAFVNDIASPPPPPTPPPNNNEDNGDDGENDDEETLTVDCSGFALQSPVNGLAYESETFYWSGVDGVSYYELKVQQGGALVASAAVEAPATSTTVSFAEVEASTEPYTWTVTAYTPDGTAACSATSPSLLREWPDIPERDDDPKPNAGSGTYNGDDYREIIVEAFEEVETDGS